jgi:hypothetical protein
MYLFVLFEILYIINNLKKIYLVIKFYKLKLKIKIKSIDQINKLIYLIFLYKNLLIKLN